MSRQKSALQFTPIRYMLISDDDGHWYCIPAVFRESFEAMLAQGEADEYSQFIAKFSKFQIGGSPSLVSFENPRW